MIRNALSRLGAVARLWRDQRGTVTTDFVQMLPVMFGLFLITLDAGFSTTRDTQLDRALDLTARDLRMGAASAPTVDAVRTLICNRLAIRQCTTKVKVQLIRVNRTASDLPAQTACADSGTGFTTVRQRVRNQTNTMLILRACLSIDSFSPAGFFIDNDDMFATSQTVLAVTQ